MARRDQASGVIHPTSLRAAPALLAGLGALLAGCAQDVDPLAPIASPVRDLARSEAAASEVEGTAVRALLAELGGTPVPVGTWLQEGAVLRAPTKGQLVPIQDAALDVLTWSSEALGAPPATDLDGLKGLCGSSAGATRRQAQLIAFALDPSGTRATGSIDLLLGFEGAGGRSQVQATAHAAFERAAGAWRISALEFSDLTLAHAALPPFVDVTRTAGLTDGAGAQNTRLLQEGLDDHRTLALGGLTVLDWNGDGLHDVLATRKGQSSTLLLGNAAGGFLPASLPIESPAESPAMVLWVDLDGDGLEELVGSEPLDYEGAEAHLTLWTRTGSQDGSFRRVSRALSFPNPVGLRRLAVQTLVPFDLEGDGDLDLFAAVYGSSRSRGEAYNTVEAFDGADNHLFVNQGALTFTEESAARGIEGTGYTYVATAFDFDGDGDLDLFEGNDFGPNHVWTNRGDGTFTDGPAPGLEGFSAYTMGSSLADYDNEGVWSLYISNMSSEEGMRMVPLADTIGESMRARVARIAQGNGLHRQGKGGWIDHAVAAGCAEGEWAWGSAFADLDGDGDQDLLVTNGFASHSGKHLPDWQTYYWRQVLADARHLEKEERSLDANAGLRFRGSFNGYERDRLFWNLDGEDPCGARRFLEVGWLLGLDADHDGRAIAPIDYDRDGDLDLALWTLQGLRLFENRLPQGDPIVLRPRVSGAVAGAIGAVVELVEAARTQRAPFLLVSGFQTQQAAELSFQAAEAATARVTWPDGAVEDFGPVGPGHWLLERGRGRASLLPAPARPALLPTVPAGAALDVPCLDAEGLRLPLGSPGAPALVMVSPDVDERAALETLATLDASLQVRILQATPPVSPFERQVTEEARLRLGLTGEAAPRWLAFDSRGVLAKASRGPLPTLEDLRPLLEVLAEEPVFPELAIEAGRRALDAGRFREAEGYFRTALERAPSRTDAWDGLARVHLAFQRLDNAKDAYASATLADPDYALGHFNLGVACVQTGDLPRGIGALERAAELEPRNLRTLLALAEALGSAKQWKRASLVAERAALLDPGPGPLLLLLQLALADGRPEEAQQRLEEAQRRAPEDPRVLEWTRRLELQQGR